MYSYFSTNWSLGSINKKEAMANASKNYQCFLDAFALKKRGYKMTKTTIVAILCILAAFIPYEKMNLSKKAFWGIKILLAIIFLWLLFIWAKWNVDKQWGLDKINVVKAWEISKTNPEILVGILDTGIDTNHEALKNSVFTNKKEIPYNKIDDDNNGYIDDINGWDFISNDNSVFDSENNDRHGTQIAGIIAGKDNINGFMGVSPGSTIIALKCLSPIKNTLDVDNVVRAIEYGNKIGVRIFNISWMTYNKDSVKPLENIIKKTNAIFICAAGNDSVNVNEIHSYPACFNLPNIISVASISNDGYLVDSNYGKNISVCAPGDKILSAVPFDKYDYSSGTSMATPFVTGIAILILNKYPTLTPIEVIKKIKNGVNINSCLTDKCETGGYIDAFKSLNH